MIELNEARQKYFYFNFLQRIFVNFKFKEIRVSAYEDQNNITVQGNELPLIEIIIGWTWVAIKIHKGQLSF